MVSVFASSVVDREFFSDKNIQWRNDDMDGLYYTVIISLSNLRINWMLGLITSNSDSGVNMNSEFFPCTLTMYNSANWNLLYIIPILTNTNCVSEHDIQQYYYSSGLNSETPIIQVE